MTDQELSQIIKEKLGIDWTPDTVLTYRQCEFIYEKVWEHLNVQMEIIWAADQKFPHEGYRVQQERTDWEFNHFNR